jgi:tripartite-type tricarboxylate transporter receptor subunit TctC
VELPTRAAAEALAPRLGQPVVVELRPGAAGAIGTREVVQATDGHSFLAMTNGISTLPALQKDLGFDVLRDLKPITILSEAPMAIVVRADSPVVSLQDLLDRAAAAPGQLPYGSSGPGSITHVAWLLLQARARREFLHVPYRGAGQAVTALYSGEIGTYMGDLGLLLPHVRDGRFRALGVTSPSRHALLPGIPAVAEAAPGYAASIWFCLLGPAATPDAVVARLVEALAPLRQGSVLARRLAEGGGELLLDGPGPLAARMAADVPVYRDLLAATGVVAE